MLFNFFIRHKKEVIEYSNVYLDPIVKGDRIVGWIIREMKSETFVGYATAADLSNCDLDHLNEVLNPIKESVKGRYLVKANQCAELSKP
jgi:hypothetical protein